MHAKVLMSVHDDVVEALLDSIIEEYYKAIREGVNPNDAFKLAIKAHRRK